MVYDASYKKINTFLTKEKKHKPFKQATSPEFTLYHYFLNRGKAAGEEVITDMGSETKPGKINTGLYYKSKNPSFVNNPQKQVLVKKTWFGTDSGIDNGSSCTIWQKIFSTLRR
jgi:hypothetical protein